MSAMKMNILAVAVVLSLTAGFTFGLLTPGVNQLEHKRAEIANAGSEVRAELARLGDVTDIYASILELDRQMQDFREKLPAERRFGEFLSDLSEALKAAAIEDYLVQPRPARELVSDRLPDELGLVAGTTILAVRMVFDTDFQKLFAFLNRIEALPRVSHVESMHVSATEGRPERIHVEIILQTYYAPN